VFVNYAFVWVAFHLYLISFVHVLEGIDFVRFYDILIGLYNCSNSVVFAVFPFYSKLQNVKERVYHYMFLLTDLIYFSCILIEKREKSLSERDD